MYKGFCSRFGLGREKLLKGLGADENLERLGLEEVIFTDISRDGALEGPGDALRGYL